MIQEYKDIYKKRGLKALIREKGWVVGVAALAIFEAIISFFLFLKLKAAECIPRYCFMPDIEIPIKNLQFL